MKKTIVLSESKLIQLIERIVKETTNKKNKDSIVSKKISHTISPKKK